MNQTIPPKVSVMMCTYNSERYIKEAIDSVLNQTFGDFELLILDDGSTDSTQKIVNEYEDQRIKYTRSVANQGILRSRLQLISESRGIYLAVLDSDDICRPNRLLSQVRALDRNDDAGFVGGYVRKFSEERPSENYTLKWKLTEQETTHYVLFRNIFVHSSLMFRRSAITPFVYPPEFPLCEDYELVRRISALSTPIMLREVVLDYRMHAASISNQKASDMLHYAGEVKRLALLSYGIKPTADELAVHCNIENASRVSKIECLQIISWLESLPTRAKVSENNYNTLCSLSFKEALPVFSNPSLTFTEKLQLAIRLVAKFGYLKYSWKLLGFAFWKCAKQLLIRPRPTR